MTPPDPADLGAVAYPESYRCVDCGEHHYLDCSLPSDVWNKIATPDTVLCARCIDARMVKAGISGVECRFYFVGAAMMGASYAAVAEATGGGVVALTREEAETVDHILEHFIFVEDDPEHELVIEAEALRAKLRASVGEGL